ncbi:tetratricopeptide repeat-containing sensor histidine kinase [Aquimarina sp. 2201CG14-23]|uniref:tetratricopeptide repeat-containing sensor histidine kinase n=1 Tax=Aquimarina mycalae TaxID=3040073 RepID=UPI002477E3D6|nr:tetratricopeptide repeat-containing sensor histidine kinase [Aquimarina sp. 2201CG14-23]MDH7448206.1 tetratricopeptide repeat-containing sensor histidine kinase [Aquimarina sp. 2201CG14-23]
MNTQKLLFLIFIFLIGLNIQSQTEKEYCEEWKKQIKTFQSIDSKLKYNKEILSKVDSVCMTEIYLNSAHLLYLGLQKTDSSLYLYDKAIKLAKDFKKEDLLSVAYTNKALILTQVLKNDEANSLLEKAKLLLLNKPNDKSWAVYFEAHSEISDNNSEYAKAIKFADSMTEISIIAKDTFSLFSSYHNKGLYNFRLSNYEEAVLNLLKALNLQENNENLIGRARTNYLLGFGYLKWGHIETAKKYLKKGIAEAEEKQDKFTLLLSYPYLAECYRRLNENNEALSSINYGIKLANNSNNSNRIARAYTEKGWLYLDNLKQYDKSEVYFKKAYDAAKKSNDDFYLHLSLQGLIELYLKKQEYENVKKYLPNFRKVTNRMNILINTQELHKIYSVYYEETRQPSLALKHLKKYHAIKDSITNVEVSTKVVDLEKKYDTKKKELEIVHLNEEKKEQEQIAKQAKAQQNLYLLAAGFLLFLLGTGAWAFRKLRKQQQELASTNQVKNHLFSIIAHDLRGMIIPFQRSGKILKYHIDKGDYEKTIALSQALEQNSERLSDTLNNLLNWSLEQMEGYNINPESISVEKELQGIIEGYKEQAAYKHIKIDLQYEENIFIDFDKGAFHVIFRNLISNALKYTEKGNIRIEFTNNNTMFFCSVIDTGIGISSDQLQNIFSLDEKKINCRYTW